MSQTEAEGRRAARYVEYVEASRDEAVARQMFDALAAGSELRNVLVAEARSGALVRAAASRLTDARRIMAVESDRELLDFARTAVEELDAPVYFAAQSGQSLAFADGVFDGAFGANSGGSTASLLNALSEVARVTRAGGVVGLWTLTSSSFSRLRELLRESAWALGEAALSEQIDELTQQVPTLADLRQHALALGIEPSGWGVIDVAFLARNAEELVAHPLIERDFAAIWRNLDVPPATRHALATDAFGRAGVYYGGEGFEDRVEVAWICGTTRASEGA